MPSGSSRKLQQFQASLLQLPPETACVNWEQNDAEEDVSSQTMAMEQLVQAISLRQRATRRSQFVSPSVRLSRLKGRYISRRTSRPAHWSAYLPQPMALMPPSTSPNQMVPATPLLVGGQMVQSPTVVIIDVEEEEEEVEEYDVRVRQSDVDAKVTRLFTSETIQGGPKK